MSCTLSAEQCAVIRHDIELILEHSRALRPASKDAETTLALLDTVDELRASNTKIRNIVTTEQEKVRLLTRQLDETKFQSR